MPKIVADTLRRMSDVNLIDSCVIVREGALVYGDGGATSQGEPTRLDPIPCRLTPDTSENVIVAEAEKRGNRFVVTFERNTTVLLTDKLEVTSTEFDTTKTLLVDEVLSGYTFEVATKAFCREEF